MDLSTPTSEGLHEQSSTGQFPLERVMVGNRADSETGEEGGPELPLLRHFFPEENRPGLLGIEYFPPPPHLADYFGDAYLVTNCRPRMHGFIWADFAHLRFILSGEVLYRFAGDAAFPVNSGCLIGPTTGATRFAIEGPAQILGVTVLPLGWRLLVDCDASTLVDSLNYIPAGEEYPLLPSLRKKADPGEAARLLWASLERAVRPVPDEVRRFVAAVSEWLDDTPAPRLAGLMERTGFSARHLSRLCARYYGYPPKLLARRVRATRLVSAMALEGRDWRDGLSAGFYDQPHLIRELKQFAGLTPQQVMQGPLSMSRYRLGRRAAPG